MIRLAALVALSLIHVCIVHAQQPDRSPNLKAGDAVVTGFSGTMAPDATAKRPANRSVVDLTFINPDGPSARIIDIARPGFVWDGRLLTAPKTFDVLAKDVGQVFGVALDDQAAPNIYLSSTSAFGLSIVGRGKSGLSERRKKGAPGAGWMRGQFGLELQGGPGSIYKVDGGTGAVSLLANVTLDGVPNPGPGLGNLAYDAANKQLFVSDLYTGMIHRIGLDGADRGRYDHGVNGRPVRMQAPVAFDPRNRPNIGSDRFDSENPATWGFAPPSRQVWGLAVREGRLYYAVTEGPQIWSVAIRQDGSFGDARWELDVPRQPGPFPVSDIVFSDKGAMILAQRAPIAGSYDYSAFTRPGEPRVMRFWLESPDDPTTPSRWNAAVEEYAVGFAGSYRNSNGGVDLGYGYDANGMLGGGACEQSLWTTGDNLRNNPGLRDKLAPGGELLVHGLQGSPSSPVRNFNEPPWTGYFVDYDDTFADPRAKGHLGGVRILRQPCPVAVAGGPGFGGSPPYISGPTTPTVTPPPICVGPNCAPCPFVTNPDGSCGSSEPPDVAIGKSGVKVEVSDMPMKGITHYSYTLTMTNIGGAFTGNQLITVTDIPPAGIVFTAVSSSPDWQCTLAGSVNCTYIGVGPASSGAPLGTITINATATGSGPWENCATIAIDGKAGVDSNLSNNRSCVTLGDGIGVLIVRKKVVNNTAIKLASTWLYPVTVSCIGFTPSPSTFSLTDGGTQTISNIPLNTSCTVLEGPLTPPPGACGPQGKPSGVPVWTTTYSPPLGGPVTISSSPVTVDILNTLDCKEDYKDVGILIVTKKVQNNTPITLPGGLTYTMNVTCTGFTPTPSTFTLTDGGTQTINNIPLNTSCMVAEVPPTPPKGVCREGTTPVWTTSYVPPGGGPVTISGTPTTVTVINALDCETEKDVGILIVTKKVQNNTPITLPGGLTYTMNVTCTGFTPTPSTFTLTDGGTQTINNIPLGTSCMVAEVPPTPPKGVCREGTTPVWTTSYVPPFGGPVTISGTPTTVTVINQFDCEKDKDVGILIVTKKVQNNTPITLPGGALYPMSVSCTGFTPSPSTFILTDGGTQTINNIPLGTSCTVQEGTLTAPTGRCGGIAGNVAVWTTIYAPPGGGPVTISGSPTTVTVINQLDCEKVEPEVGVLIVTKTVEYQGPLTLPSTTFTMNVSCVGFTPSPSTFTLTNGGTQTVSNIPLGTACTVAEVLPTPPTGVCPQGTTPLWATSYVPPGGGPVTISNTPVTVAVLNTLICRTVVPEVGVLLVQKNSNIEGDTLVYPVTVSCIGFTPSPSTFNLTHGAPPQTVSNIPLGTSCTVSEVPPTPPAGSCKPGLTPVWTTIYVPPNGGPVIISNVPVTVTVINRLGCEDVVNVVGTLIVTKTVVNNTPVPLPSGTTYPMTVNCTGFTTSPSTFTLTDGGTQTISNIPLNTSCSVQEGTLTAPTGICGPGGVAGGGGVAVWTTTYTSYPAGGTVTINNSPSTIAVTNTLDCKQGGELGTFLVTKQVVNNTGFALPITTLYPVTVTCVGFTPTPSAFNLADLGAVPVQNIPVGTACTVSEAPPPPPAGACGKPGAPGGVAVWTTTYSPSPSVVIASISAPPTGVTIINTLTCSKGVMPVITPVAGSTCDPATMVKRGNSCECRFDGMVKTAGGACACRTGTKFVAGRGCVRQLECRAPMFPNAAGTACRCPDGTVQRGRECVRPIECRPPAKRNAAGTACVCPANMIAQGNTCIPRRGGDGFPKKGGDGFPKKGGDGFPRMGGDKKGGDPRGGGGDGRPMGGGAGPQPGGFGR